MIKIMLSLALALFISPAMATDKGGRNPANLQLASVSAVVIDADSGEVLYKKYANMVKPVASLTKVMTAMVVLDAKLPLNETIRFSNDDRKAINYYHSRIRVDSELPRGEVLRLALMSSENLAAAALGRNYPGGLPAFVARMNAKARALGMKNTHFVDSSGLSGKNVSTAEDLAKLVAAAAKYREIATYSTTSIYTANFSRPRYRLDYVNTNPLVRYQRWDVAMSKTGYLDEAGRCLVMKTNVDGKELLIVMLDSFGKTSPMGDAGRIKRWLASGNGGTVASAAKDYQKRKIASHLASRATASIR
ncbi:MAG: D-alanyl-D-alanine endopeptidase (penicillin-binding protein 7) [Zhongshania aliphaticivorans]|jgi:D-alanyl-D-alanine endopeptidase (penicillin-binding protein 7)|uniref:D-alanyl-D-alanine endopeptidase n=1 Tax=Zhongshania aliphaticivorans TaxID=1470434 RepID=UPI0039E22C84